MRTKDTEPRREYGRTRSGFTPHRVTVTAVTRQRVSYVDEFGKRGRARPNEITGPWEAHEAGLRRAEHCTMLAGRQSGSAMRYLGPAALWIPPANWPSSTRTFVGSRRRTRAQRQKRSSLPGITFDGQYSTRGCRRGDLALQLVGRGLILWSAHAGPVTPGGP